MIKGGYYIKARAIQNSEISAAPPHVREIWDWLIKEANFQDNKMNGLDLKRGQSLTTYNDIIQGLAWFVGYRKCCYSKSQCETALKWLRNRNMIQTTKTTRGLLVTICNYAKYQDPLEYERHTSQTKKPTMNLQPPETINKEGEEGKKRKNEISPKPPKGAQTAEEGNSELSSPAGVGVGRQNHEDSKVDIWPTFDDFWDAYDKKTGREPCEKKWNKLKQPDKEAIMQHVSVYVESTPDKAYRKNPQTYLNQKTWTDEEIINQNPKSNGQFDISNLNPKEVAEYVRAVRRGEA